MKSPANDNIPKEKLVQMIRTLLGCESDLAFLLKLEQSEIEQLTAAIREKIDGSR